MSRLSLLRASDYQRVRWKNDGGWTTEIARDPSAAADDFRWRVSIADIESDGPFSFHHGLVIVLLVDIDLAQKQMGFRQEVIQGESLLRQR